MPGVSGCLEHTAVLSQLITEAKKGKKNLVVTWLDIENAYGSIPHSTIREALKRAHIPEKTRNLIENYYDNVKIRFTTKKFTTDWQRVERGIIIGCTLSVVIFALAMSWIVESVQNVTKGPKTSTGQRQVNSRLQVDDIATTTETVPQTRHLLNSLSGKLTLTLWCCSWGLSFVDLHLRPSIMALHSDFVKCMFYPLFFLLCKLPLVVFTKLLNPMQIMSN